MKNYIKKQRGITLIALIITIIIISILVGVTVRYANIGTDVRNYNYMCADIELLENKIKLFYNDKGTIPTVGSAISAKSFLGIQANSKDNDNYYKVDVSQLYNVTLNYGGGADADDAYIVNEQSLKVYYLKGVVLDDEKYYTKKVEVKPCTEHTYGDWTIVTAATCTTTGEKQRSCTRCGNVETQIIPVTSHTYGSWEVITQATCTTSGTRKRSCTQCGNTVTEAIAATGHSFSEWTIVEKPTTTSTGLKSSTCTKCGETKTEIIPKLSVYISFTISGVQYTAEQGMKWKDWVNSEYNTAGFAITTYKNVKRVFFKSGDYYVSDPIGLTEVTAESEIVENGKYGRTKTDSGGSVM